MKSYMTNYLVIAFLTVASHGLLVGQETATQPSQSPQVDSIQDGSPEAKDSAQESSTRKFRFEYGATINEVPAGAAVRVWYPIAESNSQQTVRLLETKSPSSMQFNRDERYNNQIGYFDVMPDSARPIEFQLSYAIERSEASVDGAARELDEQQKELFLSANSLVPLKGKPQELIRNKAIPTEAMQAGKSLYDFVGQHMKYDKSNPGYGNGDAEWACDSQTGNCTDFHSLFISLARSKSIPARFEIGFPIPTEKSSGKIGGYHCWAWFHVAGSGWAPVDISEADKHPELKDYYFGKLTADRVAFSTGRDIELVPKSQSGPLNYFVYPHVEVDGQVWPKDKIELQFEYQNQ